MCSMMWYNGLRRVFCHKRTLASIQTSFAYVIPFLISTVAGSILAFAVLSMLERRGILKDYLA